MSVSPGEWSRIVGGGDHYAVHLALCHKSDMEQQRATAPELSRLESALITFVGLPFVLVVPSLVALIAAIGWAFVTFG